MDKPDHIIKILKENRDFFAGVVDVELSNKNVHVFDFSDENVDLHAIDLNSTEALTNYVFFSFVSVSKT